MTESLEQASHEGGLEWRDVSKAYGGVSALAGADVSMRVGRITAVIGPNGAGKTTLFNCASGLDRVGSGAVLLGGRDISHASSASIARLGLTRTFQNLRMVEGATVWETVLAAQGHRRRGGETDGAGARQTLLTLLDSLDLLRFANQLCQRLSLLDQRKVELARALARGPRFVLLDEPTAGATPSEAKQLGQLIRALPGRGVSVGLIEHSVAFIADVAAYAYVMNFGRIVAAGPAGTIADDPVVHAVFVGSGFESLGPRP